MIKLVLFDIDGTLLMLLDRTSEGSNTHIRALDFALNTVVGIGTKLKLVDTHGKPEQVIFTEILSKYGFGRDYYEKHKQELFDALLKGFSSQIKRSDIMILPGVKELLVRLKKENVLSGLVTGNYEPIAHKKLKMLGIDDYFCTGGFGDNGFTRADIVNYAADEAKNKLGINKNQILLIGDTPNDIRAAKDTGVKIIAVASGAFSVGELKKYEPDFVFKDLTDTDGIMKVILS